LQDVISINVDNLDVGANEVVEVEVLSFDPGWHNYTDKETLLGDDKWVSAWSGYKGTSVEFDPGINPDPNKWSTRGSESFANVNDKTLSDENKVPLSEDTLDTFTIVGGIDNQNHFYRPQHIVKVHKEEYASWEASRNVDQ